MYLPKDYIKHRLTGIIYKVWFQNFDQIFTSIGEIVDIDDAILMPQNHYRLDNMHATYRVVLNKDINHAFPQEAADAIYMHGVDPNIMVDGPFGALRSVYAYGKNYFALHTDDLKVYYVIQSKNHSETSDIMCECNDVDNITKIVQIPKYRLRPISPAEKEAYTQNFKKDLEVII